MFVNIVFYKYRTRSKGEQSIVHAYPLKKIRSEVISLANKRRKKGKARPMNYSLMGLLILNGIDN